MTSNKNLTMKLLIDTKSRKVLFAEAGNDVVDFILSILSLPVGAIIKSVSADSAMGSIGSLYQSLEAMNDAYLYSDKKKASLLDPVVVSSSSLSKVLLIPAPTPPKRASNYRCSTLNSYSSCIKYYTEVTGTPCPGCKSEMTTLISYAEPVTKVTENAGNGESVYVRGPVTYTVMDDLTVTPASSITILHRFQVKDTSSLQEKTVELDFEKGLELLRCSLLSKTVLTDAFLAAKKD